MPIDAEGVISPKTNGAAQEWLRWGLPLVISGIIAYFTAVGSMQAEVASIKALENAHFQELLRAVEDLKLQIRILSDEARRRQP